MAKDPQASGRFRAKPAGVVRAKGLQRRRIPMMLSLGCLLLAVAGWAAYAKYGEVMSYVNPPVGMKWIAGGEFLMGSGEPMFRDAQPVHRVAVEGFWIDETEVTNTQLAEFVRVTGYITAAERIPKESDYPGAKPDMLVAGSVVFSPPTHAVSLHDHFQ